MVEGNVLISVLKKYIEQELFQHGLLIQKTLFGVLNCYTGRPLTPVRETCLCQIRLEFDILAINKRGIRRYIVPLPDQVQEHLSV